MNTGNTQERKEKTQTEKRKHMEAGSKERGTILAHLTRQRAGSTGSIDITSKSKRKREEEERLDKKRIFKKI